MACPAAALLQLAAGEELRRLAGPEAADALRCLADAGLHGGQGEVAALAQQTLKLALAVGGDAADRIAVGVPETCAADVSWDFEVVVAQAMALGIACVAEGMQSCPGDWQPLLEDLSAQLDGCAAHVFLRLSRADPDCADAMLQALQALCAWILAMLGRAVGHQQLSSPKVLSNWTSGDPLWALEPRRRRSEIVQEI
ncbi:unnamed protein product [Effrenium voratum]|nr:unnamed protein product [Effrenium voratum]